MSTITRELWGTSVDYVVPTTDAQDASGEALSEYSYHGVKLYRKARKQDVDAGKAERELNDGVLAYTGRVLIGTIDGLHLPEAYNRDQASAIQREVGKSLCNDADLIRMIASDIPEAYELSYINPSTDLLSGKLTSKAYLWIAYRKVSKLQVPLTDAERQEKLDAQARRASNKQKQIERALSASVTIQEVDGKKVAVKFTTPQVAASVASDTMAVLTATKQKLQADYASGESELAELIAQHDTLLRSIAQLNAEQAFRKEQLSIIGL